MANSGARTRHGQQQARQNRPMRASEERGQQNSQAFLERTTAKNESSRVESTRGTHSQPPGTRVKLSLQPTPHETHERTQPKQETAQARSLLPHLLYHGGVGGHRLDLLSHDLRVLHDLHDLPDERKQASSPQKVPPSIINKEQQAIPLNTKRKCYHCPFFAENRTRKLLCRHNFMPSTQLEFPPKV